MTTPGGEWHARWPPPACPVASRQVVDEDEPVVEAALRSSLRTADLVVVLAGRGGSGGEVVPRTLARIAGVRLVLNETVRRLVEEAHEREGRAVPRRLDRQSLLPQGAEALPSPAGEPGWSIRIEGASRRPCFPCGPRISTGSCASAWRRSPRRGRGATSPSSACSTRPGSSRPTPRSVWAPGSAARAP